ncbi:MAG: hypothetical protein CK532_01780 [Flavobacteriales bacterium]|nr:MAG: hypothetical protein CK532_01780 [Flavobacteriales bacterium]
MKKIETRKLKNNSKHIDNWLSQQFEDFTPNPPQAAWQSVHASLDRKERLRKFIWYCSAAGVLLIAVFSLIQLNPKQSLQNSQVSTIYQNPAAPHNLASKGASDKASKVASDKASKVASDKASKVASDKAFSNKPNISVVEAGVLPLTTPVIDSDSETKKQVEQVLHSALSIRKKNPKDENLKTPARIRTERDGKQSKDQTNGQLLNGLLVGQIQDVQPTKFFNQSPSIIPISTNNISHWTSDLVGFGLEKILIHPALNSMGVFENLPKLETSPSPVSQKLLGRWSLELSADQNQTGIIYSAANKYSHYIHKNYFERIKAGEFSMGASRFQTAGIYQISAQNSIKVGVSWAQNRSRQQFDFSDSMPATVVQGQSPDGLGYYPIFSYLNLGPQVKFSSQSTYRILSIPLGWVGHYSLVKKLYFSPEVLLQANQLKVLNGSKTLDYQTLLQKDVDNAMFRQWIWSARVALGLEKRLNYIQSIGLRLNAQGMVSPMYLTNAAVQSRGWSLGLSAHYTWRIQ